MLVDIPWAKRVWALPFLTVLAPSERKNRERGHRHKSLTDWAQAYEKRKCDAGYLIVSLWSWQIVVLQRWNCYLPCLKSSLECILSLACALVAALYQPAPPRQQQQMGRPRFCW